MDSGQWTFKTHMQRFIDQFSRYFVGGLFIFSGLIKLNDPIGTEIKLEEYFEIFSQQIDWIPFHAPEGAGFLSQVGHIVGIPLTLMANGITFLMHYAAPYLLPFSMELGFAMIVLEVVLGIAVLIYWRMNLTGWILLLLIVFFTYLTFFSAYFNKVTDCGCFGDAIKLTPWESFTKDIVLFVFVLHLFWYRKKYQSVLYAKEGLSVVLGAVAVCTFLGVYAIRHLPFIDFRAYRIGNHIPTQMIPPEQPVFEYVFKNKKTGEEISSKEYFTDTLTYEYLSVRQTNEGKTRAKITDYSVFDVDGQDVTQSTFQGAKLLFIIYDASLASTKNMEGIRNLVKGLDGKMEMMALTASSAEDFESFRHENQLAVPYYFVDATVLKTIIRSNPGITLWVDGTVRGMWHHNDTPDASEVLDLSKLKN